MNKIVVAYSGGLDTSVLLKWLKAEYDAEVIADTADVGQGEELDQDRAGRGVHVLPAALWPSEGLLRQDLETERCRTDEMVGLRPSVAGGQWRLSRSYS